MSNKISAVQAIKASNLAPSDLMINLLPEPLGVDHLALRFSWLVPSIAEQQIQTAYQVQVSKSNNFNNSDLIIWDSGETESSSSVSVPYVGEQLDTDAAYFWRVKTWVSGNESDWSEPQRFITAAVNTDWQAKPIWTTGSVNSSTNVDPYNWMLVRKEFSSSIDTLSSAWIRITAQSPEPAHQYVYKLWLNYNLIGLGPVRAQYASNNEARYDVYDVTDQLKDGSNAIAALNYAGDVRAFMLDLIVQDTNGKKNILCSSDTSWKTRSAGAWLPDKDFLNTSYYKVPYEYIDARSEPQGWLEPGFDDSQWNNAALTNTVDNLKPAQSGRMVLSEQSVSNVTTLGTNHWLLDVGKEIVGGIRVKVDGTANTTLEIRLGEEKDSDGGARYKLRSGLVYQEVWTLRDGEQQLEHWGYRAFRWVEIISSTGVDISQIVKILVLKLPWDDQQSSFTSSDEKLNAVYDFCRYTVEATRLDLYQDTPTRERGPYEGDAIINQLSEYYTQRSWALAQYSTGYFVNRRTWPTEYYLMPPILAWQHYFHTGDVTLLSEAYEGLKNHTFDNFVNSNGVVEKDVGQSSSTNGDLVDWPTDNRDGFDFQRINTVINAWQYACYDALANISSVLGNATESAKWTDKATKLKSYLIANFIKDNKFVDGYNTSSRTLSSHQSQHATAFPLALGLVEGSTLEACGQALANDVSQRGLRTSVYGAQFLLEALFKAGLAETAIDVLINTTQYSWLNMMDVWGATMTMEAWDPSMKSNLTFSHAWATAPANIVPRYIAGVKITKPGAEEVTVEPNPGDLNDFSAKVPLITGIVEVNFNRSATEILVLTLPPNVKGRLKLKLAQLPEVNKDAVSVVDGNGCAVTSTMNDNMLIVDDFFQGTLKVINKYEMRYQTQSRCRIL